MSKVRLPVHNDLKNVVTPGCFGAYWSAKDKLCRGSKKRRPCDFYIICRMQMTQKAPR